jgi:putative ABC transport system ATP-binding protein
MPVPPINFGARRPVQTDFWRFLMAYIECRNLTRTYVKGLTTITPLEALDLEIEEGSFTALMGPSGSGKTTLLNLIAGIDTPTSGSLAIGGADISQLSRSKLAQWRGENIGYIFQLYNLVPVLTAYENVELPLLLHDLTSSERHKRVSAALELVGIADRHDHFPRQLSGGQEQRVAIARAIVTDPKIVVADEPTGDLDRTSAAEILSLLRQINVELGRTLIMVTHDPKTTIYAQRILHLDKGKLLEMEANQEVASVFREETAARHSGENRNPEAAGLHLSSGQCLDPGLRRGDDAR